MTSGMRMMLQAALSAALLALVAACRSDGDIILMPDPTDETASQAPLVTVVYDANALGDRSYNDLVYEGVERAALFAPADSYGQTFTEWGPYIAQEMGIPFSHNEQFTDNADLLRRLKNYYGELARQGLVGQQLHERQLLRHRIAEPARGTGSHVHIVNSANFGNLYTTGPQEFFTRQ